MVRVRCRRCAALPQVRTTRCMHACCAHTNMHITPWHPCLSMALNTTRTCMRTHNTQHTAHNREVGKCEKPIYTVIRPLGSKRSWFDGKSPAELRQYAPMLIAQVAGEGCRRGCVCVGGASSCVMRARRGVTLLQCCWRGLVGCLCPLCLGLVAAVDTLCSCTVCCVMLCCRTRRRCCCSCCCAHAYAVSGTMREASSAGFRAIAGKYYIGITCRV